MKSVSYLLIALSLGRFSCRKPNMLNWIKNIKKQTKVQDLKEKAVTVVLGNEACDLDSGISAITLAYHLSADSNIALPLLNIPEKDYPLKTELVHCLQKLDIREEDLFFKDNLDLNSIGDLKLVLVDHNVMVPQFSDLESKVVEVLDHHALERAPSESTRMTVEKVGSCCTLVAEKIFRENPDFKDEAALTLILQTILIDTVLLNPEAKKVTDKDIALVDKIESVIGPQDRKSIFYEVLAAKEKVDHLTAYQLLRRDLKSVLISKVKVSMSAVPIQVDQFLKLQNAWSDTFNFSLEENSDVVIILGYKIHEGMISRDLLVFSQTKNKLYDELVKNLQNEANNLQLAKNPVPVTCEGSQDGADYFKMGSTVSRKILLPVVKQILTEITKQN